VVLPATSFAEKSGTVTNTCGQVQILKKTMRKAGTRSDLEILLALARMMGHAWGYRSADDVLREIIAQGARIRNCAAQLAGGPRRADASGRHASRACQ
jgi:predicted molibdopterin-dependent oxidoreductase YjgC